MSDAVPGGAGITTIEVGGRQVIILVARDRDVLPLLLAGDAGVDPAALLSSREAEVLAGFRFPRRRDDWLAGRLAAKAVILHHLGQGGLSPASIEVMSDGARLPHAFRVCPTGPARLPVSISISHRGGAAAAALLVEKAGRVGVDVEIMEPRSEALAEDNFTPGERSILDELPRPQGEWGIAIVWSLKEAALKAAGLGLSVPATDAEVTHLDLADGRAGVRLRGEASSGAGCLHAPARILLEDPLIVSVVVVGPPAGI